ncbi:hypothetical protein A2U01_0021646, partial [Trifolium medium]|nr:hypothetical protein [Trifolium medium]
LNRHKTHPVRAWSSVLAERLELDVSTSAGRQLSTPSR